VAISASQLVVNTRSLFSPILIFLPFPTFSRLFFVSFFLFPPPSICSPFKRIPDRPLFSLFIVYSCLLSANLHPIGDRIARQSSRSSFKEMYSRSVFQDLSFSSFPFRHQLFFLFCFRVPFSSMGSSVLGHSSSIVSSTFLPITILPAVFYCTVGIVSPGSSSAFFFR